MNAANNKAVAMMLEALLDRIISLEGKMDEVEKIINALADRPAMTDTDKLKRLD